MDQKTTLIEKAKTLGFPENEIVVTLEDFFEGNSDSGSIGCNIYPNQPGPQDFYKQLKSLKQLGNIDDILVRISDTEDGDWPYTDAVYIIGKIKKEALRQELTNLYPDEIYEEWMYGKPINAPIIKNDMQVFTIWWD